MMRTTTDTDSERTKTMKKNDQIRTRDIKDLAAALSADLGGLSDEALRAVAGGRPCEKTCTVTSAGVTKCCWG